MATSLGLYRPGGSLLHRMGAGWKLLILLGVGASSLLLLRWWWLVVAANLLAVLGYLLSGLGLGGYWRQLRPMWFLLVFTAVFHVWVSGWQRAVSVTGMITFLVTVAALVTLTTPTERLLQAVVRGAGPLRRFGVDPERLGLYLSIGIRAVPLVAGLARDVKEAQIARCATSSVQAFAVPLIVRSLREADAMGEALAARGVDD